MTEVGVSRAEAVSRHRGHRASRTSLAVAGRHSWPHGVYRAKCGWPRVWSLVQEYLRKMLRAHCVQTILVVAWW
jgi:hypothetical protein